MTTPRKRRGIIADHRSTKRRKTDHKQQLVYSDRIIAWEEQLSLPARFHEEEGVWPALEILKERGTGRRKEYLLSWEPHPETEEIFESTWERSSNVGQALKEEWDNLQASRNLRGFSNSPTSITTSPVQEQSVLPRSAVPTRDAQNRKIIPDSSAEYGESNSVDLVRIRTPALTASLSSTESVSSPLEISETQPHSPQGSLRVTVPPAPIDKVEWDSSRTSQISSLLAPNHSPTSLVDSPYSYRSQLQPQDSNSHVRLQATPESTGNLLLEGSPEIYSPLGLPRRIPQRVLNYQSDTQPSQTTGLARSVLSPQSRNSASLPRHGLSAVVAATTSSPVQDSQINQLINSHGQSLENNLKSPAVKSEHKSTSLQTQSSQDHSTRPWKFKSQISLDSQPQSVQDSFQSIHQPEASSRNTERGRFLSRSQNSEGGIGVGINSAQGSPFSVKAGMASKGTRQSPRLQTNNSPSSVVTPRIAVRSGSYRTRSNFNPPEHSSPLAATAELAEPQPELNHSNFLANSLIDNTSSEQVSSNMSADPPTSIAPSAMHLEPIDTGIMSSLSQTSPGYDIGLNTGATIQDSIEEEVAMSSAEDGSLASKASSSQESLRNEQFVPQVDGLVMPTYPILGVEEYAIALPAEGKIQAVYNQAIQVKRKAINKFIRRRGSVNEAGTSANKTIIRNEMLELVSRLHDTTTHMDLGLPGIPTQYDVLSHEHAAYADYAGSKFVFLGYLVDYFRRRDVTVVIMAASGAVQNLLEEYLTIKQVNVQRHERASNIPQSSPIPIGGPRVEIITTRPTNIVRIDFKPQLIIAFDASFDALDPQVRSLRAQFSETLPIVHLLVTNSSEHVERCLPVSMPSPIRLKLLVRATYQAAMNLGGSPTIVHKPSDEIEGRPMDLGDINKALRKSPNRKLEMVAAVVAHAALSGDFASNWTLSSMPELVLDELEDVPSTDSTVSAATGRSQVQSRTPTSRGATQVQQDRSRTPLSRASTPSARKRQLDVEPSELVAKRMRMTPVGELHEHTESNTPSLREQELLRTIETLRADLTNEKKAKEKVDEALSAAEKMKDEWQASLSALQRRYEKRTHTSHQQAKVNKTLTANLENLKLRLDKVVAENMTLKQRSLEQRTELESARNALTSAGGDIAALETARAEGRNAAARAVMLEKSLDSTKRDFEFLRNQYQEASSRAAELGTQVLNLEGQVQDLTKKASDEKRLLREINFKNDIARHLDRISQLEAEKRSIQVMYRKIEEENKLFKRNRGVQTRGSSTAPGSPGPRSRQGSPALTAPPSGSRASLLRNER